MLFFLSVFFLDSLCFFGVLLACVWAIVIGLSVRSVVCSWTSLAISTPISRILFCFLWFAFLCVYLTCICCVCFCIFFWFLCLFFFFFFLRTRRPPTPHPFPSPTPSRFKLGAFPGLPGFPLGRLLLAAAPRRSV